MKRTEVSTVVMIVFGGQKDEVVTLNMCYSSGESTESLVSLFFNGSIYSLKLHFATGVVPSGNLWEFMGIHGNFTA